MCVCVCLANKRRSVCVLRISCATLLSMYFRKSIKLNDNATNPHEVTQWKISGRSKTTNDQLTVYIYIPCSIHVVTNYYGLLSSSLCLCFVRMNPVPHEVSAVTITISSNTKAFSLFNVWSHFSSFFPVYYRFISLGFRHLCWEKKARFNSIEPFPLQLSLIDGW